jgi:hypothetical protein
MAKMPHHEDLLDILMEENPDALLVDGFKEALIGISRNHFHHDNTLAVYDASVILDIIVAEDAVTYDEAMEYFEFTIQGAYVGKNTPLFIFTY